MASYLIYEPMLNYNNNLRLIYDSHLNVPYIFQYILDKISKLCYTIFVHNKKFPINNSNSLLSYYYFHGLFLRMQYNRHNILPIQQYN